MTRILLLALAAALAPPVHAELIARVPTQLGAIEMYDHPGDVCLDQARMAVWVGGDGSKIGGCWRPVGTMVGIVFFDGDVLLIPPDALSGDAEPTAGQGS